MDQKQNESTLNYFAQVCVKNNVTWKYKNKLYSDVDSIKMIFRNFSLQIIYYNVSKRVFDPLEKNFLLNFLLNAGTKNDIKKLSKEVDEIKNDIQNLNDKFAVLIDALTIIDQKITMS